MSVSASVFVCVCVCVYRCTNTFVCCVWGEGGIGVNWYVCGMFVYLFNIYSVCVCVCACMCTDV